MADNNQMLLYAAAYETADAALADMDAVEQLHKDKMIGKFDAAVIDQQDGKPHIVKRMDRSRLRAIPEIFGGGTLPRKELKEAAGVLTANQAGLVVVGEPTIEQRTRQGVYQCRQSREALCGRHDRRNLQRAAGSAQKLTMPRQSRRLHSKHSSSWAVQHRYDLLICRSVSRIRRVRRNPYPQLLVHLVSDAGAPGPVLSNQSVRKNGERSALANRGRSAICVSWKLPRDRLHRAGMARVRYGQARA